MGTLSMKHTVTRRDVLAGAGAIGLALSVPIERVHAAAAQPAGRFGATSSYCKHLGFLRRNPELTHEQFVAHWKGVHGPLFGQMPGVVHYALNVMTPGAANPYDGAAEIWWESEDALLASMSSDSELARKSKADGQYLIDFKRMRTAGGSLSFVSREIEVKRPAYGAARPKFKKFYLLKRLPGMSDDEFAAAWRDHHAKWVASGPVTGKFLAGYTLNIIDHANRNTLPTGWDGYASLWYEDVATYRQSEQLLTTQRAGASPAAAGKDDKWISFPDSWAVEMDEEVIIK